eukprot:c2042_g1_i1.p1 GENE.c2042_g1_i1~~c2042_g1_i1.p1  ORF type:complete len:643 (+),score=112.35 c2042_g1_i1:23-1930(+)
MTTTAQRMRLAERPTSLPRPSPRPSSRLTPTKPSTPTTTRTDELHITTRLPKRAAPISSLRSPRTESQPTSAPQPPRAPSPLSRTSPARSMVSRPPQADPGLSPGVTLRKPPTTRPLHTNTTGPRALRSGPVSPRSGTRPAASPMRKRPEQSIPATPPDSMDADAPAEKTIDQSTEVKRQIFVKGRSLDDDTKPLSDRISELQTENENLSRDKADILTANAELNSRITALESTTVAAQARVAELETEQSKSRAEHQRTLAELQRAQTQTANLERELNQASAQVEQLQRSCDELRAMNGQAANNATASQRVLDLTKELQQARSEMQQQIAQFNQSQAKLQADHQSALAESRARAAELEGVEQQLQARVSELERSLSSREKECLELKTHNSQLEAELRTARAKFEQTRSEAQQQVKLERSDLQTIATELQAELRATKAKFEQAQTEAKSHKETHSTLKARIAELERTCGELTTKVAQLESGRAALNAQPVKTNSAQTAESKPEETKSRRSCVGDAASEKTGDVLEDSDDDDEIRRRVVTRPRAKQIRPPKQVDLDLPETRPTSRSLGDLSSLSAPNLTNAMAGNPLFRKMRMAADDQERRKQFRLFRLEKATLKDELLQHPISMNLTRSRAASEVGY